MKLLFKPDADETCTQLKAHYSALQGNLKFVSIRAYIEQAQIHRLTPLLGDEQLLALADAFDADTLSAEQEALLPYVQRALVYYILVDNLPFLDTFIGEAGILEANTRETQAKPKWKYTELVEKLAYNADIFADNLLAFLEKNKANYPDWVASPAYTFATGLLVNNADAFSAAIPINASRRAYLRMRVFIARAERELENNISKAYLDLLKTQQLANTTELRNIFITEVAREFVCFRAFADCLPTLQTYQTDMGFHLPTYDQAITNKPNIDLQTKLELRAQYTNLANNTLRGILDLLNASPDIYTEYRDSGKYIAPEPNSTPYDRNNECRKNFSF
jgi:hypothetical protein